MSFADTMVTVRERFREFWRGPYAPKVEVVEDIPPEAFLKEVDRLVESNPSKHWKMALPSGGGHVCLIDDSERQLEVSSRRDALLIIEKHADLSRYPRAYHRH